MERMRIKQTFWLICNLFNVNLCLFPAQFRASMVRYLLVLPWGKVRSTLGPALSNMAHQISSSVRWVFVFSLLWNNCDTRLKETGLSASFFDPDFCVVICLICYFIEISLVTEAWTNKKKTKQKSRNCYALVTRRKDLFDRLVSLSASQFSVKVVPLFWNMSPPFAAYLIANKCNKIPGS